MIGRQLLSPRGYKSLKPDTIYYLLSNDQKSSITKLIQFIKVGSEWRVVLLGLPRSEFEYGLMSHEIEWAPSQKVLPPYLVRYEGLSIDHLISAEDKDKSKIVETAENRLRLISPLVERIHEILALSNPDSEIASYAKSLSPRQNQVRVSLWFFAYILHGNNLMALLPLYGNSGRWDRAARAKELNKPGSRGASGGKRQGYLMGPEEIDKIINAWDRYANRGVTIRYVYIQTLRNEFGCRVIGGTFAHPNGLPYPTERQFRYHVGKQYSQMEIDCILLGKERVRNQRKGNEGKFSESITNLMEKVEADAFVVRERPAGMAANVYREPLYVVVAICVGSGLRVGIGMSIGAETGDAYRMCLFCMAVEKRRFAGLFGINPDVVDWPSLGLPGEFIVDRGAGSTVKSGAWLDTMTPSYAGQSKASIESSHRRGKKTEGAPEFKTSKLKTVELARLQIEQVMLKNRTSNAGERRTPEMIASGVGPSPIQIWNYMDGLARNNAQPIAFDDAVRKYLRTEKATVRVDGIWLNEQRYDASELRTKGLYDKVAKSQRFEVDVYVLSLCVRHIWFDYEGKLFELEMRLPLNDDMRQTDLSLEDTVELSKLKAKSNREHRNASLMAELEFEERHDMDYGPSRHATEVRKGSPKKKVAAKIERDKERKGSGLV